MKIIYDEIKNRKSRLLWSFTYEYDIDDNEEIIFWCLSYKYTNVSIGVRRLPTLKEIEGYEYADLIHIENIDEKNFDKAKTIAEEMLWKWYKENKERII